MQLEQAERAPPAPGPRFVRPRVNDPSTVAQANSPNISWRIHRPAPAIDHHDASQTHESSSPSSPSLLPSQPPRDAGSIASPPITTKPPQAITLPRTDEECAPTLTEVNPESGSITGGARIWLKGVDFPAHIQLYARFGTAVVPTVSLKCFPLGPHLTSVHRHSPPTSFLPAICLPRPCQVLLTLRSRSTPNQVHRSTEPVSQNFAT